MKTNRLYWCCLLFFLTVYLLPLGMRPLISPDEFRYAEIPREMIVSGDWTVPRMLGLRYFEKPVLGYWVTALSFKLFGQNAFALRLPSALAALLSAFWIALLAHQTLGDRKIAGMTALLFLSAGLPFGIGTYAVLDMPLCAWLTGTAVTAFLALQEKSFTRRKGLLLILCGVQAGTAFLTKGFLGLAVPALTVAGYLVWEKRWKDLISLPWLPLLVCLLVVLPWSMAIHRAEPDFWRYFIMEEHWNRFAGGKAAQHSEGWFYYLPILFGGLFPAALVWMPEFLAGRCRGVADWKTAPVSRFALAGTLLPLIFFSISSGKLPTYILPCFPFAALLSAVAMARIFRSGGKHAVFHWSLNVFGFLLTLAGMVFFAILLWGKWNSFLGCHFYPAAILTVLGGIALMVSCRRNWQQRTILFFVLLALLMAVIPASMPETLLGDKTPEKTVGNLLKQLPVDPAKCEILTPQRNLHLSSWVTKRSDLWLFETPGELDYGCREAKKNQELCRLIKTSELVPFAAASDKPLIFIARTKYDTLDKFQIPGMKSFTANQMVVRLISPHTAITPIRKGKRK